MSRRIERRDGLESGSGSMNTPERLEELEERKLQHERLKGKPEKTFSEILEVKLKGDEEEPPPEDEPEEKGAKDPLLGLSPMQSPSLAEGKKGRRSGKVILKG